MKKLSKTDFEQVESLKRQLEVLIQQVVESPPIPSSLEEAVLVFDTCKPLRLVRHVVERLEKSYPHICFEIDFDRGNVLIFAAKRDDSSRC